jgi:hypothetical protein
MRVLTSGVISLLVACRTGCAADRPETRIADEMESVPAAGTKQRFDYYYHATSTTGFSQAGGQSCCTTRLFLTFLACHLLLLMLSLSMV